MILGIIAPVHHNVLNEKMWVNIVHTFMGRTLGLDYSTRMKNANHVSEYVPKHILNAGKLVKAAQIQSVWI